MLVTPETTNTKKTRIEHDKQDKDETGTGTGTETETETGDVLPIPEVISSPQRLVRSSIKWKESSSTSTSTSPSSSDKKTKAHQQQQQQQQHQHQQHQQQVIELDASAWNNDHPLNRKYEHNDEHHEHEDNDDDGDDDDDEQQRQYTQQLSKLTDAIMAATPPRTRTRTLQRNGSENSYISYELPSTSPEPPPTPTPTPTPTPINTASIVGQEPLLIMTTPQKQEQGQEPGQKPNAAALVVEKKSISLSPTLPSPSPRRKRSRKLVANANANANANITATSLFRRCAGCAIGDATPAQVWCCECARCLCTNCDERMHDTDALDSLRRPLCSHRVEYIVDGGGVPILSPLLELSVLFGAMYAIRPLWTGAGTMLNVDYFFESVCPMVQKIRRLVFELDHALYPVVRGQLGSWCDTEDAFVKIFTDLWVRSILTHTDSFALLILKAPSTIGALLVILTIAPLMAIPYAILATGIRWIEITIFPSSGRCWTLIRMLTRLIRLVSTVVWLPCRLAGGACRSTMLGLVMDRDFQENFHRRVKIPPKTGHRKRPTPSHGIQDLFSLLFGATSRVTRIFWYFHRKARRAIIATIVTVVFLAVSLRMLLLSMPRCGNGLLSKYAKEQMWALMLLSTNVEHENYNDHDNINININETDEPAPKCVSIDVLARKLSVRLGVQIPEFESLGEEGRILAKMQDATENDYIDDTLHRIFHGVVRHFLEYYPLWLRVTLCSVVGIAIFAGGVRRLLFWADLRRRHRYRDMRLSRLSLSKEEAAFAAAFAAAVGTEDIDILMEDDDDDDDSSSSDGEGE